MNRQELFDYINGKAVEVEKSTSLDDLKEFKDIVLQLQDVLPDEKKDAMEEVKALRDSIVESEAFIEEAKAKCDKLNGEISNHTKDINACNAIVKRINAQEKKVIFDLNVNELIKKTQTFEDALRSRIDAYHKNIVESSFLIEDAEDVDLDSAYKVADSYVNPISPLHKDIKWTYAEKAYNEAILELCKLKVQGEYIAVTKDKARFDVIDDLIAQYEERLFRNVK